MLSTNLADSGIVTASSWLASAPPTRLQTHHTTRRWSGRIGDTEYILLVFDEPQAIDCVALFRCAGIFNGELRGLSSSATTRVRISSADVTGLTGDLYDSGAATGRIGSADMSMIVLLPAEVTAKAVLIDISQTGASALQAGRLVVGLTTPFTINFSYGWAHGYADLSRRTKSAGGLTFVDPDDSYKVMTLPFDFLDAADIDMVRTVDRLNGLRSDVLVITDPEASDLPAVSIWGLMQDLNPPTQPGFSYFSKSYAIEERL